MKDWAGIVKRQIDLEMKPQIRSETLRVYEDYIANQRAPGFAERFRHNCARYCARFFCLDVQSSSATSDLAVAEGSFEEIRRESLDKGYKISVNLNI